MLAKDLLEQAWFLTNREPKKTRQASLRRAVSTAYYALFHALCAEGVAILAPNIDSPTKSRIIRWFDHSPMKQICGKFLKSPLPDPLLSMVGQQASMEMQRVARNFIALQEARHKADYDVSWNVNRTQAQALVQSCDDAWSAWMKIRKSHEANIFILYIFHSKLFEAPRS